jgi:hypothetical protein
MECGYFTFRRKIQSGINSQIEMDLKNDVVAHEASLKAAKTSYFKLILCGH